jgi:hypothetical protein
VLIGEVGGFWRYKTAGSTRPPSGRREGGRVRVRKLKILVAILAMTMLFASPAFAQGMGEVGVVADSSGSLSDESVAEIRDMDTIATAEDTLDGDVVVPLRKHGVRVDDVVALRRKHGV